MIFYHYIVVCYIVSVSPVFFFKQKTAYDMRISDWSSYVCSSDLGELCLQQKSSPWAANSLIFIGKLERAKGFEPSTPTLARLCSTPELRPLWRPARLTCWRVRRGNSHRFLMSASPF